MWYATAHIVSSSGQSTPPHRRQAHESPEHKFNDFAARVQVGNLPLPGTAPAAAAAASHTLQLVSREALADAQRWVRTWPEARGATRLLPALRLSAATWRHTAAVLLFSDGLIDDGGAALAFLEAALAAGEPVPQVCNFFSFSSMSSVWHIRFLRMGW